MRLEGSEDVRCETHLGSVILRCTLTVAKPHVIFSFMDSTSSQSKSDSTSDGITVLPTPGGLKIFLAPGNVFDMVMKKVLFFSLSDFS